MIEYYAMTDTSTPTRELTLIVTAACISAACGTLTLVATGLDIGTSSGWAEPASRAGWSVTVLSSVGCLLAAARRRGRAERQLILAEVTALRRRMDLMLGQPVAAHAEMLREIEDTERTRPIRRPDRPG